MFNDGRGSKFMNGKRRRGLLNETGVLADANDWPPHWRRDSPRDTRAQPRPRFPSQSLQTTLITLWLIALPRNNKFSFSRFPTTISWLTPDSGSSGQSRAKGGGGVWLGRIFGDAKISLPPVETTGSDRSRSQVLEREEVSKKGRKRAWIFIHDSAPVWSSR